MIREIFGAWYGGLAIAYAVETSPLGTGGAIRLAARACSEGDIFGLNGDSFVELQYADMLARHREARALLSVCVVEVPDTTRYGRVLVEGGRITGFTEKGVSGPGLINAGVYLMRRDLIESAQLPEAFSFERDVLLARVNELRPLAHLSRGRFIDIGVPEDYERAQAGFFSG